MIYSKSIYIYTTNCRLDPPSHNTRNQFMFRSFVLRTSVANAKGYRRVCLKIFLAKWNEAANRTYRRRCLSNLSQVVRNEIDRTFASIALYICFRMSFFRIALLISVSIALDYAAKAFGGSIAVISQVFLAHFSAHKVLSFEPPEPIYCTNITKPITKLTKQDRYLTRTSIEDIHNDKFKWNIKQKNVN